MNHLIRKHLQSIKLTMYLVALTIFAFTTAAYTLAWTGPTVAPTGGNTSAPLNVTATGQIKNGGLTLGASLATSSLGLNVYSGYSLFGFGATTTIPAGLVANFNGGVGSSQYCDQSGGTCITSSNTAPKNMISFQYYGTSKDSYGNVYTGVAQMDNNMMDLAFTWVAPVGVTRVRARVWGGGAAGGIKKATGVSGYSGGGGGYAESIVTVVPGNSYKVVVGRGGYGHLVVSATDLWGGDSSFNGVIGGGGDGGPFGTHSGYGYGGTATGQIAIKGQDGQEYVSGQIFSPGGSSPMGGNGGTKYVGQGVTPGGGSIWSYPTGLDASPGMVILEY